MSGERGAPIADIGMNMAGKCYVLCIMYEVLWSGNGRQNT